MHVHIVPPLAFLHMYVCLYVCNQSINQSKTKHAQSRTTNLNSNTKGYDDIFAAIAKIACTLYTCVTQHANA